MTFEEWFEDEWDTQERSSRGRSLYLAAKRFSKAAWDASTEEVKKDHFKIGEEVDILPEIRARVKAKAKDGTWHTYNPADVRRIPAKSYIDEIAEEAAKEIEGDDSMIPITARCIKSAILRALEEKEASDAWEPKDGEAVMFPWYDDDDGGVGKWYAGIYKNRRIYFAGDNSMAAVGRCKPFDPDKIGKPWDEV